MDRITPNLSPRMRVQFYLNYIPSQAIHLETPSLFKSGQLLARVNVQWLTTIHGTIMIKATAPLVDLHSGNTDINGFDTIPSRAIGSDR